MIDDGMLERFPVKGSNAVHNWPVVPVGEFGVVRGPAMAATSALFITVEGVGGHAAFPHLRRPHRRSQPYRGGGPDHRLARH